MGHVLVAVPHCLQIRLVLFVGLGKGKVSHFFGEIPHGDHCDRLLKVLHVVRINLQVEGLFVIVHHQVNFIEGNSAVYLHCDGPMELVNGLAVSVSFSQTLGDCIFKTDGDLRPEYASFAFARPWRLLAKLNSLKLELFEAVGVFDDVFSEGQFKHLAGLFVDKGNCLEFLVHDDQTLLQTVHKIYVATFEEFAFPEQSDEYIEGFVVQQKDDQR